MVGKRYDEERNVELQRLAEGEIEPKDLVFGPRPSSSRWGIWTDHRQKFDARAFVLDSLAGTLSINRVSDNDYWRDFSYPSSLSPRLLSNDGSLSWSKGDWSGAARMQKYQTLQYAPQPIIRPFDRMPQITANYSKSDWNGFDASLQTEYTNFRASPLEQCSKAMLENAPLPVECQPNGERVFGVAVLSRPFVTPGTFITPKLTLNTTSYRFDGSLLSSGTATDSRTVSTAERHHRWCSDQLVAQMELGWHRAVQPCHQ